MDLDAIIARIDLEGLARQVIDADFRAGGSPREVDGAGKWQRLRYVILPQAIRISLPATVGFLVVLLVVVRYDDGWVLPMLAAFGFMGVVTWQSAVVQPRVLARRHAQEAQRDPVGAARARRRERILCWVGMVVGLGSGTAGLIVGLVASGRI